MAFLRPIEIRYQFVSPALISFFGDNPTLKLKVNFNYYAANNNVIVGDITQQEVTLDTVIVNTGINMITFRGNFIPSALPEGMSAEDLGYRTNHITYLLGTTPSATLQPTEASEIPGPSATIVSGSLPFYYKNGLSEQVLVNFFTINQAFEFPHSISTQNNLRQVNRSHPLSTTIINSSGSLKLYIPLLVICTLSILATSALIWSGKLKGRYMNIIGVLCLASFIGMITLSIMIDKEL
jgi:hypothetical protein